ncbi:hypothetical protein D3C87_190340 [compost metagenome]
MTLRFCFLTALVFSSLGQTSLAQTTEENPVNQNPPAVLQEGDIIDVTPRSITDLSYFPPAGLLNLEMGLSLDGVTGEMHNSSDVHIGDVSNSTFILNANFQGGIAEWLKAGVDIGIGTQTIKFDAESGSTDAEAKNKGFTNPAFNVDARVMNYEKGGPFDLAFQITYIPKIGTPKSGNTSDDGNLLNGRDVFIYGLSAYKKWGVIEGMLRVKYLAEGTVTKEDASSGNEIKDDGASQLGFDLGLQSKVANSLFANAGILVSSIGKSTSGGDPVDAYTNFGMYIGAKLVTNPDKSFIKGGLLAEVSPDRENETTGSTLKKITHIALTAAYVIEF